MYLTNREVCEKLRVSRWTVDRLIKAGLLEAIKAAGPRGRIKISEESVYRYITQHAIPVESGVSASGHATRDKAGSVRTRQAWQGSARSGTAGQRKAGKA